MEGLPERFWSFVSVDWDESDTIVWIDTVESTVFYLIFLVFSLVIFGGSHHIISRSVSELPVPSIVGASFVAFGTVTSTGALLYVSHLRDGTVEFETHVTTISVFIIYVVGASGITTFWGRDFLTGQVMIIGLSQAGLLAAIYAAFSSPMVPERDLQSLPEEYRAEYLEMYMDHWWQWARLTTSLLIAFGITLVLGIVAIGPDKLIEILTPVTANLMFGGLILGVYAFLKKRRVHDGIRELLQSEGERFR